LFSLRDCVDQAGINTARRLQEVRQSGEQGTPVAGVVLSHLHLDVRHQLEGWAGLVLIPSCAVFGVDTDAPRVLRLVSFWVNERVCTHLDPEDRGDYTPVGPADVNLQAGGVLFFDEVERLLTERIGAAARNSSPTRDQALESSADVALFILEQGFSGVLAGDVARLEALKVRLRHGNIPAVVESGVAEQALPRENRWRVCALAAAVFGFYACSAWLSQGLGGL
jgi:hypothetical protein